jgi:hypothetical protein
LFQIEDVFTYNIEGQCAAVIGFDIYVIGGIEYVIDGIENVIGDILNSHFSNSCRCFNAVTKIWRDVSPMNQCR